MVGYDVFMWPLESIFLSGIRKRLIKQAYGRVLEIGIGTAINCRYYDFSKVQELVGTDIRSDLSTSNQFKYVHASVESLPFEDNTFDTVVGTLLLCSINDINLALKEIKRVLKPGGSYLFIEHIRPSDIQGKVFDKVNLVWGKNPSGCQINKRTMDELIKTDFYVKNAVFARVFGFGIATKAKNPK